MALDNVEVTDVKARQRYPWNGKVDIDFTLDSKPTEPYQMQVEVYDNVGKTNLPVKSVCTENVSVEANPCMVRTDTSRIVWDAAKDLPNGFKCTNVLVTCRDARTIAVSNLYCVIDLTTGAKEYLSGIPAGGWTDEHKTTKMVFRRIEAGSFMMGSPASDENRQSNEAYHKVTITRPFYIAIYEMTESQYAAIINEASSVLLPKLLRYHDIRGCEKTYFWPENNTVDENSLVGKFRVMTGFSNADLPTEAQWEYSAKGGSVKPLGTGYDCTAGTLSEYGRYEGNVYYGSSNITYVGRYSPNAIGLYDMSGNAREWCLDIWQDDLGSADQVDPVGGSEMVQCSKACFFDYNVWAYATASSRVVKGGGWSDDEWRCQSSRSNWGSGGDKKTCHATQIYCRPAAREVGCSHDLDSSAIDYKYWRTFEGVRLVFPAE